MIRKLRPNEIECRVQTIRENGCSLLLYKDARADMKILDETYGVTGWQRTHELIGGNLYCTVSIWDPEKEQWISKQDVGVESYTEKEKGQASDSFKRACFNLGIGRELYTAPFIWIALQPGETYINKGKPALNPKVKFTVTEINYNDEGEIVGIKIVDQTGKIRYEKKATGSHRMAVEESKPQAQPNTQGQEKKPSSDELSCQECKEKITQGVATFSMNKYGKPLCMSCQKKQG